MRIAKVLLRWYKSFSVNYMGYPDRKSGVVKRPWNLLGRSAQSEDDFPFIEVSLEDDITTIVGANESGKSHLLSAVSKVITGHGIPEGNGNTSEYSRTDLCHYTSPRSKNAEDWPNIGLQFRDMSQADLDAISKAVEHPALGKLKPDAAAVLTLILAPDNDGTVAYLYPSDSATSIQLDKAKLATLRQCLPKVEFIKSTLAISDQVSVGSLLSALGGNHAAPNAAPLFDYKVAQQVAAEVFSTSLPNPAAQLPVEMTKTLHRLKDELQKANLTCNGSSELEALLFRDVLGITCDTLKFVANLEVSERTHADSLATKWNREIEETLNLSHYWQQDDSFALKIAYRQGVIYFEITDKTGATYTFKERSSGLRYFLSYYIQAKALERTSTDRNTIVLMDEPDSFLSILGQRSLLAVFESLVRPESSTENCQLIYTTHSPFLINRNFPRRLRLVRKGDAEEGTQVVDQAMLRRYEPVRSALGIDCAQTLFMGATNIVVEGPTDQYIICELIRIFITPENVNELLDLNSLVMVSAESAPSVEKVLAASKWGDESIPATVVLLDSDAAGCDTKQRITGKAHNYGKKLIDDKFVLLIADVLGSTTDGQKVLTTEDLIPAPIYADAVVRYVEKWHPEVSTEALIALREAVKAPAFAANGVVEGTRTAMDTHVHTTKRDYDKLGVLQEVVAGLREGTERGTEPPAEIGTRLKLLCEALRRTVSASQQMARRITGKQAIQRLIDEFFITHKQSSSVFDVQLLIERLKRDTELLGVDGEELDASLKRLAGEIEKARSSGQARFTDGTWGRWKSVIAAVRKNPLSVAVRIVDGSPTIDVSRATDVQRPDGVYEPSAQQTPPTGVSQVARPMEAN